MVPSSVNMLDDLILRTHISMRSVINHSHINTEVTNTIGGRMVTKLYNFLQMFCNDLYNRWNAVHNSVVLNSVTISGESTPFGTGGVTSYSSLNLHLSRIYNVNPINYFNYLLNACDFHITAALDQVYQSLRLNHLSFHFIPPNGEFQGTMPNDVYKDVANNTESLSYTSFVNRTLCNTLGDNLRIYLSNYNFVLSNTQYIHYLIDAIDGMINNQLTIYLNQTNWVYNSCSTGPIFTKIANGGRLI